MGIDFPVYFGINVQVTLGKIKMCVFSSLTGRTEGAGSVTELEELAVPPTPPPSGYSVAEKMQVLSELDIGMF